MTKIEKLQKELINELNYLEEDIPLMRKQINLSGYSTRMESLHTRSLKIRDIQAKMAILREIEGKSER